MEYRTLGRSGLKVSLAGIGCNNFGMTIDEAQTRKVVDAAVDAGINFFDTADCYGGGNSEVFLGKALGKQRDRVLIATKFGVPMGRGPLMGGASRRYVIQAAEASLRRLGTDYIDLYILHVPDPDTPIGETLDALTTLVDQGKVRYIGCSNHAGWQISDAHWTAESAGMRGFVAAQNEWSLVQRSVEAEVVPACAHHGLGILPYFPLASGALTGKYRRGEEPAKDSRFGREEGGATFTSMYGHFIADEALARVERLEQVAAEAGIGLVELALSWLGSQRSVSSVIAGATRPEQVEMNAKSTRGDLGADVLEAVEKALGPTS
ncbi:MAG: aldo/keto reductase [Deltaproteobacteria bacterium]|jgi:aryl-alcohol dehydrogenase-like predicted oxidoreductase|nr:aldo/keto reductase [Deltaproteobacteria bacterium]